MAQRELLMHITCEIIIITSIFIYFYKKISNLQVQLETSKNLCSPNSFFAQDENLVKKEKFDVFEKNVQTHIQHVYQVVQQQRQYIHSLEKNLKETNLLIKALLNKSEKGQEEKKIDYDVEKEIEKEEKKGELDLGGEKIEEALEKLEKLDGQENKEENKEQEIEKFQKQDIKDEIPSQIEFITPKAKNQRKKKVNSV